MPSDAKSYPKKYWWVVAVALPIVLALVAVVPRLLEKKADPGTVQTGDANVAQVGSGNINITNNDLSSKMYVTNVAVIVSEYEKLQGQPLTDAALKEQIERAVAEAVAGRSGDSVRLFEDLARKLPLPAIYNNLGVEYARTGQTQAATKAFNEAIQRDPEHQEARKNLALLAGAASVAAPAKPTAPAMKVETSSLPSILIEPLTSAPGALKEVHIVDSGTEMGSSYRVRYSAQPGSPTIVEPGRYDMFFKSSGDGTFVLARNVEVKEGTQVRVNPAALVGYIVVEPLTGKGFPEIKEVTVFKAGETGYRLIFQHTENPGELLPIVPGVYEIVGKTDSGQDVLLAKSVDVTLFDTRRIRPNDVLGGFVVHDPKLPGAKVENVYVLRTGTNEIAAQSDKFEVPLVVSAGEAYDIALKQPGGLAKIKIKVTPKAGEVLSVP